MRGTRSIRMLGRKAFEAATDSPGEFAASSRPGCAAGHDDRTGARGRLPVDCSPLPNSGDVHAIWLVRNCCSVLPLLVTTSQKVPKNSNFGFLLSRGLGVARCLYMGAPQPQPRRAPLRAQGQLGARYSLPPNLIWPSKNFCMKSSPV